jgi:hypothetical protein
MKHIIRIVNKEEKEKKEKRRRRVNYEAYYSNCK